MTTTQNVLVIRPTEPRTIVVRQQEAPTLNIKAGVHITKVAGGDVHYTHTQSVAASEWVIAHDMGKYPSVTVVDSAGSVVVGDVAFTSLSTITVSFGAAFAGVAYLN